MKIAIVTGGSRGLGKSMAQAIASKGNDVILTYNSNAEAAQTVVSEIQRMGRKTVALQLDAGEVSSFGAFADRVKLELQQTWNRDKFDFLVNNAGTGVNAPYVETTEEQFDELMNLHVKGPFFLTQKLLPMMNNGGRIVNVSSGLARVTGQGGYSAYASMKGAIEVLTRYQALELGARGITANVVAPGATETDFAGGLIRDNKQYNEMIAKATYLGRVGLPDDIGPVVASLLSDDMGWVSGQRIEAAGGRS